MSLPTMSVINFATGLDDHEVQDAVRAVNRQITEDFAPIWGTAYNLRVHPSSFDPAHPDILTENPARGESVLYLVDQDTVQGVLGYHDRNSQNIPVGFVFVTDTNDWTTTLSHEALELIIDPTVNVMVPGPDPRDPDHTVLHAYEVCDAVERTSYFIDETEVSNFVTQSWFTPGDELGTRNDFLGVGVPSFNATTNSHLAFLDLTSHQWVTFWGNNTPEMAAPARRAETYYRDARERNHGMIQHALSNFKLSAKADALPYLHGLTRNARHEARVKQMFG